MLVRLEMDEKFMSFNYFGDPPGWAMLVALGAHLIAGIMIGALYFSILWWNSRRLVLGGGMTATIALMIGRFVILAGLLTLASLQGALPLLVMALGVLIARSAVMRRFWLAAP
ncbi:F1F0 ATPase subunit 2 [Skermanella aerolata]|uniref:ATP synthase subunit I n=1 Tax=Skermanella aerolata TaxID=393310 RepID=UPI003D1C07F5